MFLNFMLPGAKSWKVYWVEIHGCFIEISTDCGKDPFTAFHIAALKFRQYKKDLDHPDVLEFYNSEGSNQFLFLVFTYDPYDLLDFLNEFSAKYKEWHVKMQSEKQTISYTCDVKPPGIFASSVQWVVDNEKITVKKSADNESVIPLDSIMSITPCANQSKVATFKYTIKNAGESGEHRCTTTFCMKQLLDAIYTNASIIKLH